MSPKPTIKLSIFGQFRVDIDGHEIHFRSAPARILLAILVLSDDYRETRSRIGALLWEEADDGRVKHRLRQVLYGLRSTLGPAKDAVLGDTTHLRLSAPYLRSDLAEIEDALANKTVPALLLEKADRLNALLIDLPEPGQLYASWLAIKRRNILTRISEGLQRIVDEGVPTEQERAARILLVIDESDEFAARFLIEYYARHGEIGKSLQIYSELWAHLDEHYDMEPSEATQRAITRVKLGECETVQTVPAAAGNPAAAPRVVSLAVPAITVHDATGTASRLASLFRVELMGRLSRFREISVVDSSILAHTPAEYRLDVIDSSQCHATRLILTLTEAANGHVLWNASYEELANDWPNKIIAIAGSVSAACNLGVSRARLNAIRQGGPSQRAFDHWLMGQRLLEEFRGESRDKAIAQFKHAIELDPYFSGAYSSLSQEHNGRHLARPGLVPNPADLKHSRDLAHRAIALDPEDSRAHLCRAWASQLLGDYSFAAGAFADALECNPNDPWTVISSALGAAFSGNHDLALSLTERTIKERWANTPSMWAYHATIRFMTQDYAACVDAANIAGTAIINIPAWRAAALSELGQLDQAAAAWQEFEQAARPHWAGDGPPTTAALAAWFRACFPIKNSEDRNRLFQAVDKAVKHHWHCVTM